MKRQKEGSSNSTLVSDARRLGRCVQLNIVF